MLPVPLTTPESVVANPPLIVSVLAPRLTAPLASRLPAVAFQVWLAPRVSGCVMVCVSASLIVIPPEPIVSTLPPLLPRTNAPAVLAKVRDAMVRLESRSGVRRVTPAKVMVSLVLAVEGAPLGFQLLLLDQSLLLPLPPSQTKLAA